MIGNIMDVEGNGENLSCPLVSCIMPTYNRRKLVPQAIEYFLRQDYPNRELIIIDDGSDAVGDIIPQQPNIRYIRIRGRNSIGTKRNRACIMARGKILICWDDDDWYGPHRISRQVQPLLSGRADVTGIDNSYLLDLPARQFWRCSDHLHQRMFFRGVVGGTITFWKKFFDKGCRFPNTSLAEDAAMIRRLLQHRARLEKIPGEETFVYVRHHKNSWRFPTGNFLDKNSWQKADPPPFIPAPDLEFYSISG